ncbi:hypothetical protein CAPTEDRAFT_173651 [Capitella teleta]|uniref:Glucosidase 2 subunit beta n=1 Tax=Capitella teleta TaxID=283909 RepID=X1ZD61_CAPTE|nr:hypothetical protein CAPTEDRAFT_173651 [Capitella teleta]|eukprot:ELU04710.1 hypothetical protein CAPTEDRAFT_173651 [Capitella teleta]
MKELLFIACLALLASTAFAQLKRPRGVAISKAEFYQEGRDFQCLDGSQLIAFEKINDDYCDCDDGSDEPGTAACPNGSFHCTNAGHKPKYIPSSRVNDGICDCCDGSDEYDGRVTCANYCKELGKQMREELEKQRALLLEGYEIYKEYVHKGTEARKEKQNKLDELRTQRDELKAIKDQLEDKKQELEIPEKEAKDKHRTEWEETKALMKEEKNKATAKEAFDELDANADQIVTVEEMQVHQEFDIDNGGEVSAEEAREYLEDHPQVDFEVFYDKIWENIKEVYKKPGSESSESAPPPEQTTTPPPTSNEEIVDHFDDLPDEEDDEEEFLEDEEDLEDEDQEEKVDEQGDDFKIPEYDEETKKLIEAADQARREFDQADSRYREVDRELTETEKVLALDFGPNNEFYPLRGECYEFTDREYTYKLCPFEKATQRNKHGGTETNLGHWGKFDGPENRKYAAMKYEKGQNCYNGPDRSCYVKIECGLHNELRSSAEPNRCEYEYVFASPAACREPPPATYDPNHDEL